MQFEADRRRIIGSIGDHFLQDSTQNAFLQCYRGTRVVPELFQVIAQCQQLLALLGCELWSQSAGLFQTSLHLSDVGQGVVPSRFHFDSNQTVLEPDATHVAGFRTWNSLGRFVKRGEKGIVAIVLLQSWQKSPECKARVESASNYSPIEQSRGLRRFSGEQASRLAEQPFSARRNCIRDSGSTEM